MNIVDSLTTIIAATVVVVLVLGVIAFLAYRLRPARKPEAEELRRDGSWYFIRHDPDGGATEGR